jgi:peroxiredoxin
VYCCLDRESGGKTAALQEHLEVIAMLKVGDKAPEFRVKADDGKDVSLSDFRGKRVLLFFFPKANTSG